MFLWLKTLYRKRAVTWPFIFYTIIWTLSIYTTGELSFHLSRIKGLSSIFEGPINYTTFNNYGDGLNYFYPFLTIIPAVVFYDKVRIIV